MSQNHNDLELAFHEHGAFLRRLALVLTADAWEAEDATQDTFLAAVRQQPDHEVPMRPWLATVLRRTVQKRQRSRSRRLKREQAEAQPESRTSESREALFRNLAELVAILPHADQSLLIRRYWEGLNAREIAERDGISKSTVESRLKRALDQLRQRMDARSGGSRAAWALAILAPAATTSSLGWKEGLVLMSLKKIITGALVTMVLLMLLFSFGVFDAPKSPQLDRHSGESAELETVVRRSEVASTSLQPTSVEANPIVEQNGERRPTSNGPRGNLTVRLKLPSGDVAANRVVLATALDREVGLVEVQTRTDSAGIARFLDLPVGRHELVSPRGGQRSAMVVADVTKDLEWQLYEAPPLVGRVTDPAGQAIAGATIHLSLTVDPNHFAAAAETDGHGHFQLQDVGSTYVVVTAAGYLPSTMTELADADRQPLNLTLQPGGKSLQVRVLDEDLQPLPGAWCRVLDASVRESGLDDHSESPISAPEGHDHSFSSFAQSGRSDTAGRVQFTGLGSGNLSLEARAQGYRPRRLSVNLRDQEGQQEIVLAAEHILRGVLHDEAGQPLADVRISSGSYRGAQRYRGLTDADGSFEVQGLMTGMKRFEVDAGDRGQMQQRVEIGPLPITAVSWTLDPGLSLRAVVLDDVNAPVVGLRVRARPLNFESSVTWRDARTDANGRFELTSVENVAQLLEFYDPKQDEQPILVVKGLKPQTEEHRIVLGQRNRALSFMSGRVVNDANEALVDAEIVIFGEDTMAASSRAVEADGSFRYGPFGAGRFTIMISAPGYPEVTKVVNLERDQELDLGAIVLPRPGRAIVTMILAANTERGIPSASIVSERARSFDCRVEGDRCISPLLEPGRYTFRVWTARYVEASRVIEIKSGQDTELDLRLELGAPIRISLSAEEKSAMPKEFRVLVRREDGIEVLDRRHDVAGGFDFQIFQVLPSGRYQFIIENDLGMRREQSVTLPAPGQPEVSVTLDLSGR